MKPMQTVHIHTPRLVHPEQAADFKMETDEAPQDGELVDTTELHDDELVLNAEELFRELDQKESEDGQL